MSARLMMRLAALVSLSGAAAIGHELLWIRALALHFGSTTHAVTAVVATFMAGLACGNAWFGRSADRHARPLWLYRQLEVFAAISGCAVSLFLLLGGSWLDGLARLCAAAGSFSTFATCAVFAALMLIPTTIMGGTLPVLSRAFSQRNEPGHALALLYACNTAGAVLGALLPDFALIPNCGLIWTALTLAAGNLLAAALTAPLVNNEQRLAAAAGDHVVPESALRDVDDARAKSPTPLVGNDRRVAAAGGGHQNRDAGLRAPDDAHAEIEPAALGGAGADGAARVRLELQAQPVIGRLEDPSGAAGWARSEVGALVLSAATGFCCLGLEVLWSRTLQSWAAAFVTSFSVLLALYLSALAVGAWLARRWTGVRSPLTAASVLCAIAAGYVVMSVYAAPSWRAFAARVWPRPEGVRRTGLAYEAVATVLHAGYLEGAVCLLLGAAFPFVAATWLRRGHAGARTGQLFVVNTVGGVLGTLATGFWLLPTWGEQTSYCTLAVTLAAAATGCALAAASEHSQNLAAAMHTAQEHSASAGSMFGGAGAEGSERGDGGRLFELAAGLKRAWVGGLFCLLSGLGVVGFAWGLPRSQLAAAHFQGAGEILAVREGATTSAAAVAHYVYGELHYLELQTPGVSMSNTRLGARRYMAGLAHAGMLLGGHARRNALLICYGVGNTAQALLSHSSLQRLDVVDISPEVLDLAPYFAAQSGKSPLLDPRTHVFVDDGRHHLITHDAVYDVITAEPPPPNHAGVVNLYTREFYRLAKRRLSEAGVITQWLPVFQLSDSDVRSMIAAFVAELPHSLLLYGYQQQLILVGSRKPLQLADTRADAALLESLRRSGYVGIEDLLAGVIQTDAELRSATKGVAALDDLHPTIAYPFEAVRETQVDVLRFARAAPSAVKSSARAEQASHGPNAPIRSRGEQLLAGVSDTMPPLAAAEDALWRALAALEWMEAPRSELRELELGRLLQPALSARPDDEHIWTLLAADHDRVRVAEAALARPGAQAVLRGQAARGPRYGVLQDALWVLARRAFYARDYPRALELLKDVTPEAKQRALHALLTGGALRALGDLRRAADSFRAAAHESRDANFQRACGALATHVSDPVGSSGPWSIEPGPL